MKVLVVKKTTNLDLLGERIEAAVAAGLISHAELKDLEEEHRQHISCLAELRDALSKADVHFLEVGRDEPLPNESFDIVLSHGGDGTLLTAGQHLVNGGVLAGICSTDNSVGHLCAIKRSQITMFIRKMVEQTLPILTISRMRARIERIEGPKEVSPPVINDILYTHTHPAGMSRYRLSIGKKSEEQKSSGIWLSTAIGSTAAIKAAGGQVLESVGREFQYLVRERYRRSQSMAAMAKKDELGRGTFDPDNTLFTIFNRSAQAILAFDGQRHSIDIEFGDKITIERAHNIQLVGRLSPN